MRWVMLMLTLSSVAHAAPLLALDDVYDCGFANDGTVVAATSGGLRIGSRVVTALDGLPDTRVDAIHVGASIDATTHFGIARVSLEGVVSHVVNKNIAPPLPASFEPFGRGIVRARHSAGERVCIATSDGLFVGPTAHPLRVAVTSLPTGDVSAIAPAPGGLFVGTFDQGLYRMRDAQLTRIDDTAIHAHINALLYDDQNALLWIATARGLTRCEIGNAITCRRVADRFSKHTLLLLDGGRIAAGGDESIAFLSQRGDVEGEATRKNGARFRSVWSLARVGDTIYAGTTSGIFYGTEQAFTHAPEKLERIAMARGSLPDDWITALLVDGDRLYVGTYNAGVVALDVHSLERVGASPELGYVNPNGLSKVGDAIAVCTMNGLHLGHLGAWARKATLGRDVTAATVGYIATRRGVSSM